MRLSFNKYLAITVTLLCFSNFSSASSVVSCDSKSNNGTATFDYGDATVSNDGTAYGEACHDTNRWQQLGVTDRRQALEGDTGDTSDDDNENRGWTGEESQNNVDQGDNGVTWRTQNADLTWSDYGIGELTAGDKVQYKFIVTRSSEGNHQFDQLKAWTDWNDDGTFDDSERIIDKRWDKDEQHGRMDQISGSTVSYNNDLNANNSLDTRAVFKVTMRVPLDAVIGNTWMRARVICENSLTTYDRDNNIFHSTGYYHQGEVEDYKLTINAKAVTPVPEPTTLFVFASALIGLVLSRKKA